MADKNGIEHGKSFSVSYKMPRYTACYDAYLYFVVPKSVSEYLLEEYDAKNDGKSIGSWWIRYGTFYYIDKEGNRQEIESQPESDVDYKRPSGDVMIDDCDDGEDE
jgi:hypothetical protein